MTEKEKLEAIKAEIERLKSKLNLDDRHDQGASDYLYAISKFIDSLPEEPVSEDRKEVILKKAHELVKEVDLIKDHFPKSAIIAVACDMAEWCDAHPIKKPVSEDLESEIDKWYKSDIGIYKTREQFGKMIHHFAQWQKQKTIGKACDYMNKFLFPRNADIPHECIEDFRKILEED